MDCTHGQLDHLTAFMKRFERVPKLHLSGVYRDEWLQEIGKSLDIKVTGGKHTNVHLHRHDPEEEQRPDEWSEYDMSAGEEDMDG
jgi:hypothetical protein